MKYALLFLTGMCLSVLTDAQNIKVNSAPDKLKVTLSENNISVSYKNQPTSIGSVQALDSLMKKISGQDHLIVEFESINAEPEKVKSINAVLKQCKCHIARKSVSYQLGPKPR